MLLFKDPFFFQTFFSLLESSGMMSTISPALLFLLDTSNSIFRKLVLLIRFRNLVLSISFKNLVTVTIRNLDLLISFKNLVLFTSLELSELSEFL